MQEVITQELLKIIDEGIANTEKLREVANLLQNSGSADGADLPQDLEKPAWDAYLDAILDSNYWFSWDELL